MKILIVCVVIFITNLIFFLLFRKRPKMDWTNVQKMFFIILIIGNIIDVLQTHFAVNIMQIAIELNPLIGPEFPLIPAIIVKILVLLLAFQILNVAFHKIKMKRKCVDEEFWRRTRYFYLIIAILFQWSVVIYNETNMYFYLYKIRYLFI